MALVSSVRRQHVLFHFLATIDVIRNSTFALLLGGGAILNFLLMAFNLLPVYPLDGGRITQALLWWIIPSWEENEAIGGSVVVGTLFTIPFAMWALQNGWIFAAFILIGANALAFAEWKANRKPKNTLHATNITDTSHNTKP